MNVVIKVNDEIKEKMIEYYKDKRRDKVIPYVVFQAQDEDTVITTFYLTDLFYHKCQINNHTE